MKACLQRNPEVIVRDEEDGALLYNLVTGATYVVNTSGGVIWSLCTGDHSLNEIEEQLKRRFTVDEGTTEAVRKFVNYLVEQGLVIEPT